VLRYPTVTREVSLRTGRAPHNGAPETMPGPHRLSHPVRVILELARGSCYEWLAPRTAAAPTRTGAGGSGNDAGG
jgi:hypothetical protein